MAKHEAPRVRARVGYIKLLDIITDADGCINIQDTLRSRARVAQAGVSAREAANLKRATFYDPAILNDTDAAVDYALAQTGGDRKYRRALCFYCLRLGINTFLDQLDSVMACARAGEVHKPAAAFHSRLRHIADQLLPRKEAGK